MKPESKAKAQIVADFKAYGQYARRFEDQFLVGFPDMILVINAMEPVFAEVKIFQHRKFEPSPRQYIELCRLNITWHCIPAVIGIRDGIHYFHPVAKECRVENCLVQKYGEHIVETTRRFILYVRQQTSGGNVDNGSSRNHH